MSWSRSPDPGGPVEEPFQAAKGLAGLDEHQVRRWTSGRRTLLAMLAHALPALLAAHESTNQPAPTDMIALTCSEIRRLFTELVVDPARSLACPLAWSQWRRRHRSTGARASIAWTTPARRRAVRTSPRSI